MIQIVEAAANVSFDEPDGSPPVVVDLSQRGVAPAARSESMRAVAELRLVVRLQQLPHNFLQQLVGPRGHAERTQLSGLLRNVDPPHRRPSIPLEAQRIDDAL